VKVVFLETVEGSGAMGEVRDVAPGYARNYLLPRGLAAPATPQVLRRASELAAIEEERQRTQDEQARGLVGKLEGQTLVVAVRVGEQGRLYGSVTGADIAEKAGEILGEELDRRRILLPEVIRRVGLYQVPIRLSRNVTAEAQVAVVDAEAPEGVEAAVQALLTASAGEDDTMETASSTVAEGVSEPGESSSDDAAASASATEADSEEAPAQT
jgi:large subunit ribosomal protein L9